MKLEEEEEEDEQREEADVEDDDRGMAIIEGSRSKNGKYLMECQKLDDDLSEPSCCVLLAAAKLAMMIFGFLS
jgi:hypothetical protein